MKTRINFHSKISNTVKIAGFCLFTAFAPLLFVSCSVPLYVSSSTEMVQPPEWAPVYDDVNTIHYYYIPDIQAYYDVYRHEFIYIEDGNWVFSAFLPSYYANFNINNAYVVVLNSYVHEPWRHHEEYASHYPRYYYHSNGYNQASRGYNENSKAMIYNSRNMGESNHAANKNGADFHQNGSFGTRNNQRMNEPANNNGKNSFNGNNGNNGNKGDNGNNGNNGNHGNNGNNVNNGNNGNNNFNGNSRNSQGRSGAATPAVQESGHIKNDYPIQHESLNGKREGPADKTNRTAPVEYRSRNVGQPVKVTKDMKSPKDAKAPKTEEGKRQR